MRVSTQFSIAVHALLMIAYFPETRITSEIVARSVGCNPVIIRNTFSKLKRAGLLSIKAGRCKIELAKPFGEITLWDIYCSVETSETAEIFKFHQNTSVTCPVGSQFRTLLSSHLDHALHAMKSELSAVTLLDLKQEIPILSKGSPHKPFV